MLGLITMILLYLICQHINLINPKIIYKVLSKRKLETHESTDFLPLENMFFLVESFHNTGPQVSTQMFLTAQLKPINLIPSLTLTLPIFLLDSLFEIKHRNRAEH